MCGIFGYIGQLEDSLALRCLNTLSHRGPDGYRLSRIDHVTLGHRRLSILDTSPAGAQPMTYKDRYSIIFNGEIYNFVEVKKELERLGHSFRNQSDTEIILAAYDEWKEKCLDKLNGMWAFALWDKREKVLFLSRDRFGKKPLFYSNVGNDFCFASEMKAITPLLKSITPDIELVKNKKEIFYYESTDRCLIKEIKRFPAGFYGYVRDGKLSLNRYWNTLDHLISPPQSYEEQVEKFQELFKDACAIRMRSDVPVGTALSGGLDSSAVLGTLAYLSKNRQTERASKDWQHAFSASFPGSPIDEAIYAKEVADYAGVALEKISIDPNLYIKNLYDYLYLFEDIYITSPIPFIATYQAMRKDGVIVTLDGHGADELFGGYSFDYLHIIHDELFNPKAVNEVINTYYQSQINNSQFEETNPSIFKLKQIGKNIVKRTLGHVNHSVEENHPAWQKMDYFTQKLYISSHQTVLPTLLRNYDRYSMINGVEIRMPFMDHRIVTYALSLPWQAKIRNGFTKSIVRDAVAPFMPKQIAYRRTKVGFNSPMTDWIKGPLKEFFIDTVRSQKFMNSNLVDADKINLQLKNIINNPNASFLDGESVWINMSPYFWEEGFLKRAQNK